MEKQFKQFVLTLHQILIIILEYFINVKRQDYYN